MSKHTPLITKEEQAEIDSYRAKQIMEGAHQDFWDRLKFYWKQMWCSHQHEFQDTYQDENSVKFKLNKPSGSDEFNKTYYIHETRRHLCYKCGNCKCTYHWVPWTPNINPQLPSTTIPTIVN